MSNVYQDLGDLQTESVIIKSEEKYGGLLCNESLSGGAAVGTNHAARRNNRSEWVTFLPTTGELPP